MSELAPGFFSTSLVTPGTALVMNMPVITGCADVIPRLVAMHPTDWERIPGADREQILDELTSKDAERGLRALQRFLVIDP